MVALAIFQYQFGCAECYLRDSADSVTVTVSFWSPGSFPLGSRVLHQAAWGWSIQCCLLVAAAFVHSFLRPAKLFVEPSPCSPPPQKPVSRGRSWVLKLHCTLLEGLHHPRGQWLAILAGSFQLSPAGWLCGEKGMDPGRCPAAQAYASGQVLHRLSQTCDVFPRPVTSFSPCCYHPLLSSLLLCLAGLKHFLNC